VLVRNALLMTRAGKTAERNSSPISVHSPEHPRGMRTDRWILPLKLRRLKLARPATFLVSLVPGSWQSV
jgi:hypothetical protein